MDYEPHTIALVAELLHPPIANDPRPVQRLHNEMFEGGQPAYAGFQVTQLGPVLSNPVVTPGAVSQVAFLVDRVQFREERSNLTHEVFAERVRAIVARSAELRQVPVYMAQTVVVRSLVNPRTSNDTRVFLRDRMLGLTAACEGLGQPIELVGLRLGLGPGEPSTPLSGPPVPSPSYALRIESWQQDPRSLFLELAGNFGAVGLGQGQVEPYLAPAFAPVEENILATYRYMEERVLPFIRRFDRRQDG